jgi:hypothetical protein
MNSLLGHSLILGGAALTAYAISFGIQRDADAPEQGTPVVVIAPKRTPEPAVRQSPALPQKAAETPLDRDGLARQLQRELKRVGCYEGEITGAWNAQARKAMKAFTEHVNATLPVDQPDYILLRLLQGHPQRACGAPCPAGQSESGEGRCLQNGTLANSARPPEASRPPPVLQPAVAAPSVGAQSLLAPSSSAREDATAKEGARLAAVAQEPTRTREEGSLKALPDGEVASEPVYQRTPRRAAKSRPANKPPKIVRMLIRNVQRSLAPFGIR